MTLTRQLWIALLALATVWASTAHAATSTVAPQIRTPTFSVW